MINLVAATLFHYCIFIEYNLAPIRCYDKATECLKVEFAMNKLRIYRREQKGKTPLPRMRCKVTNKGK